MVSVDVLGKACPVPLIETKKAISSLKSKDVVEVLTDFSMAVENIKNFALDNGYPVRVEKLDDKKYKVIIEVNEIKNFDEKEDGCSCGCDCDCGCDCEYDNIVVAIGSNQMGSGDEKLGKNLMKAFIYSLSQAEVLPKTMLFYNSGAYLTCEDSLSLEDLNNLKEQGVKIMTCGTCLDFYNLKDKLKVGDITNMYDIVNTMEQATLVIRP